MNTTANIVGLNDWQLRRATIEITDCEITWLAGLFEGEACFRNPVSGRSGHRVPRITIKMTDQDVIQRVATLCKATGKIHIHTPKKATHKKMYCLTILGIRAVKIMELILPYMCERRSEKIKSILSDWMSRSHKMGRPRKSQLGIPATESQHPQQW